MSRLRYQCVFCKEGIKPEEDSYELDPCALDLISNFDHDAEDRKSQTFFCHIACFRRVADTDSVLYILDRHLLTPRERQVQEKAEQDRFDAILDWLRRYGAEYAIWERLLEEEVGYWVKLADLVAAEALDALRLPLEEELGAPFLIAHVADYYAAKRRSGEGVLVLLAADRQYGTLGSLVITRP